MPSSACALSIAPARAAGQAQRSTAQAFCVPFGVTTRPFERPHELTPLAQAAAAKKQFPALTFDPADAALLHKRRCAACRAVQAGLAASPPLPPCDAAKRLFIQLPNCPELPKPPKPEPAKASPRIPSRRARSAARAESANDHAMAALQRIMDAAEELMGHLIEDGAEAADTAAEVEPPEIVIKCRKPPRGLAEVGSCSRPGSPGYKLAVYGLCFLRAARGRLACGRMAVVPAAGAPHPLLSALLPAVLPGRVVMAEVHLHDSTVETLQAAAFDDGTGPQVDLVWDVLRHAGLTDALGVLEVRPRLPCCCGMQALRRSTRHAMTCDVSSVGRTRV